MMNTDSIYSTSFFINKRVAIIGASGFIGSHLVDHLLSLGCSVLALSRNFPGLIAQNSLVSPKFSKISLDIKDANNLKECLKNIDIVVHLASGSIPQSSNQNPHKDIDVNLQGALNVLEASLENKVSKVIIISSGGTIYGIPEFVPIKEDHSTYPICSYGIIKLSIEKYAYLFDHIYGLNSTILRLANPYGPRQRMAFNQGVIPAFFSKAINGQKLEIWGDGSVVRDFIYISDVIDAICLACQYDGGDHSVFNIGSGNGLSLKQLISTMEILLNRPLDVSYSPSRSFDVPTNVLSIERAKKYLNWQPKISYHDGLQQFYNSLISLS